MRGGASVIAFRGAVITLACLSATLGTPTVKAEEDKPLRALLVDASTVLVGEVARIEPDDGVADSGWVTADGGFHAGTEPPRDGREWYLQEKCRGIIRVIAVLKGAYESPHVEIVFDPRTACSSTTRLSPRQLVVLAVGQGFRTLGARETLRTFEARISEFLKLQAMKDPHQRDVEIIEWLVRCAEDPATAWEGASELATTREFRDRLSDRQRERLILSLLRTERIDRGALCLLRVASSFSDRRVLDFALRQLAGPVEMAESAPADLMEAIARQMEWELGEHFAADYKTIWPNEEGKRKRRELVNDFLRCARERLSD